MWSGSSTALSLADSLPSEVAAEIATLKAALDVPEVDYEATVAAKLRLARAVFDAQGGDTLDSSEFKEFCTRNWEWLRPYAVFCFLRDLFGTAEHWRWGALGQPTSEVRGRKTTAATGCCVQSARARASLAASLTLRPWTASHPPTASGTPRSSSPTGCSSTSTASCCKSRSTRRSGASRSRVTCQSVGGWDGVGVQVWGASVPDWIGWLVGWVAVRCGSKVTGSKLITRSLTHSFTHLHPPLSLRGCRRRQAVCGHLAVPAALPHECQHRGAARLL